MIYTIFFCIKFHRKTVLLSLSPASATERLEELGLVARAELAAFQVGFCQGVGEVHDTGGERAVLQAVGVAEFMDGLFDAFPFLVILLSFSRRCLACCDSYAGDGT